jgi:hypothetical protein
LRTVLFALVALVALGSLVAVSPLTGQPHTSQSSDCTGSVNKLVIDFGPGSNIPPIKKCAQNFTGTAWELFAVTGMKVEGTAQYPTGFACRIEGYPSAHAQPCLNTPDGTTGSWAYYFATAATKQWRYSPIGAAMRKPACGDVEGWLFVAPSTNAAELTPSVEPDPVACN